ncbi:OLC1v1031623C1 [Oldenlandia corymbosa var. corymbosa]|uniref:OLC1v1031623C1 n=1 Tax=Oldenlandia corymbosa var. corymbosa TaxID=529605 RepID=A0AAV1CLU2_OLDCO|nr:OLC1v1031623C1 [Oldenlandia corymbosa var. corymbosa]
MAKHHRSRLLEIDLNQPAAFDEEEENNGGMNIAAAVAVAPVVNPGPVGMVRDEARYLHHHHDGGISENPPKKRRTPREDVRAADSSRASKPNHGDGGDGGAEGGGGAATAADESAALGAAAEGPPGVELRKSKRLTSWPYSFADAVLLEPLHSWLPELRPTRGPRKSKKANKKSE